MSGLLRIWGMVPLYVQIVLGMAVCGLLLVALYQLLLLAFPKVAAIARTTARDGWSQPLFWFALALGMFVLLLFPFIPYNTFGNDVKMVKETGLVVITELAIVLSIWTASVAIADELEGRTALTLLSKPVGRRSFIIGKFLGVIAPSFSIMVLLGGFFLATINYKVGYDARENSQEPPTAAERQEAVAQIVPGLALAFMEVIVLTSISVAISTRLPMLPNLLICASVFALGHLVPQIVNSRAGRFEVVKFVGQVLATILPVLDHFNMQTAVSTGGHVPLTYLGVAAGYAALYTLAAMIVALLLFENRDLA